MAPSVPGPAADRPGGDEILRAKYLDYCSAQLAGALLLLAPDQIYQLAQEGASSEGLDVAALPYDQLVHVATRAISRVMPLPPFEVWVEDYRRHPERYDEYLLGLWQEAEEKGGPTGGEDVGHSRSA